MNKGKLMQVDMDWVMGLLALPLSYIGKLIWDNHKSLQDLKREIARDYPTFHDMKSEIRECSDQKDKMLQEQKDDLKYIRSKVDSIVNRMLDK